MTQSTISLRRSAFVGGAAFLLSLLCFVLGAVENEASGRGAEFTWMRLGEERARNIVWHDRLGLADVGWRTARALNRTIGGVTGIGNNAARGWPLALVCAGTCIDAGAFAFYLTLFVASIRGKMPNQA